MKISTKFILSSIVVSSLITFLLGGNKIIVHDGMQLMGNGQ